MSESEIEERNRLFRETEEDLLKSAHHLLIDIHQESIRAAPAEAPLTRTMARFASLLCVLSIQADKQSTENLLIQKRVVDVSNRLYWLTIALSLVALAQIVLAYLQLKEAKVSNRNYQHNQNADSSNSKDDVQNDKK